MPSREQPSRHFCFTDYQESSFIQYQSAIDGINYHICQIEKCPETGRLHVQGYLQTVKPMRLRGVQTLLSSPVHLAKPFGSLEQNRIYCTEENTKRKGFLPRVAGPWEIGTPRTQGQRTDLEEVRDMILEGGSLRETLMTAPAVLARAPRFVETCLTLRKPPHRETKVTIFYGPPGAGKTRRAYELDPDLFSPAQYVPEWWDGYDGELTVLLDDYDPAHGYPTERLLRLLDRYPTRVPIKGGFRPFMATHIIITTNHDPRTWYSEPARSALLRRCTIITVSGDDPCGSGGSSPAKSPQCGARMKL